MSKVIGMLGPCSIGELREHLYSEFQRSDLPKGLGGTPVNLLVKELLRRGHRLIVFSLDREVKDEVVLEGENIKICIGPFRPKRARDFFRAERDYLLQAIKREKPDFLHAQWTYEYAQAAQASGIKHLITAHDAPISVLRHNFIPYRIARTFMAYCVLARAKNVISVSPYVAKHIKRFMLYRGEQQVIPNGMPEELFSSAPIESVARPMTFATILSNWGHLKNGQAAIEAFAILRESMPDCRLVMFGGDFGPGEVAQKWASDRGIAEKIEFAGHTPHREVLVRLRKDIDVLVHPSLEEAQPMVLIEAMALGVPAIAGRKSGGVPWTLNYGKAGLLVDVTSSKALSEAMKSLMLDPVARRSLAVEGRSFAKERFHIGVVADAYEQAYGRICQLSVGR